MRNLDDQEKKIVRELIKNPRISDNKIAKATRIPVMTVNRKRKQLEEDGLLKYYTNLDTGEFGTGKYKAKQLYMVKFKIGMTRKQFMDEFEYNKKLHAFSSCYISTSYLGERDGHLTYMCILDAETESKMMDEFNDRLVPYFKTQFGEDCIEEIITMRIRNSIRVHHNYVPMFNMEKGTIKKEWPDEYIFVDEEDPSVNKSTSLKNYIKQE